jgi:methionyl-tRNA formyltransferase
MRVVFLGNAAWSVPSLEALAASHHRPVLVLTRSARPAGRGSRLQRTPVAEAAERLGLPLMEIETVKTGPGFEALAEQAPEILVVVAYGEILPKAVLDVPSIAPVNVHFSLLPRLRGPAPVQRAILETGTDLSSILPKLRAGQRRRIIRERLWGLTGVTTIRMDEGVDTGPILMQQEEWIRVEDDAGSLGERLARLGGSLLVKTLDGLERGTIKEQPQDESQATYAPKLAREDRLIRWAEVSSEDDVLRTIPALSPEPGAETYFRGRLLKLFRASAANPEQVAERDIGPGEIMVGPNGELLVGTMHWPVVLEEVQPEGKRRMRGTEFVRGYRPQEGEILG